MRVGIVGAGASGMMAAVTAAEHGAEVVLIEKNERVGKKILSTGNGKCNIGNLDFQMEHYYCDDKEKLSDMFSLFSVWDLLSFFESKGMMVRDKNGYLYPYSEQASTVLDFFRRLLAKEKVEIISETEIREASFDEESGKFLVKGENKCYQFDRLILSCGGPAAQKKGMGMSGFSMAESFGHTITKVVPGLVQLRSEESFLKITAGVRAQAKAKLLIEDEICAEEKGEVQFTEYGVSGIPIFQFSRMASYALADKKEVKVVLNLFPEYEDTHFWYSMRLRYETMQENTLEEFLTGTVNKKINTAMIKKCALKPDVAIKSLSYEKVKELLMQYRELTIHISAVNGMENAQVCAGGVKFSEISTEAESVKRPGLFLTGELVDVDGKCGGYNLQWAFTSGYIAGRNAAGDATGALLKAAKEGKLKCLE